MKKINTPLYGLIVLTLLLSACNLPFGNAEEPTLEVPLATLELTPTPTMELVVPEAPTIGSTISWFDTSTLVYVPAGEFVMGMDEPKEQDFNPAHPVSLNGFWIYSPKVTNEMYNLCVSLGQCTPAATTTEEPGATLSGTSLISYITGPEGNGYALKDLPATNVTWDQADNYCKWVGGRLPTEAEWEKTARGTKIQPYPWGEETPTCDLLNFGDCNGLLSSVLDHPEGISDYMALDMAGNAYEWVSDWYAKDYYTQSPLSNPTGPVDGEERSVRGSSFDSKEDSIFSALRSSLEPDQAKIDVGFRCVVEDPAVFAPICEAPAAIPADATAPKPGQSVSGDDGSTSNPDVFDLSKIGKFNNYCANKAAKLGGGTLSENFIPVIDYYLTYCNSVSGLLSMNFPPSIVVTILDGPLPTKSKYGYSGPQGASFEREYFFTCENPKTVTSPTQGVAAACAAGYTLQVNGVCHYGGIKDQQASVSCPGGYSYNSETQCCTQNPLQEGNQTNQYPVCGPGNFFDPKQNVCFNPPQAFQYSIPDSSVTFKYKLGTCEEPPNTDKPSQPQQPEPTPCVIDPFTGACH